MLSDEEIEKREDELKKMEEQIEDAGVNETKAAPETPVAPPPEPPVTPPAPPPPPPETPTQETPPVKPEDDPLRWAEKKGFKGPEDMARALLQKEREFHESRQRPPTPPPPHTWNPPQPEWRPEPSMSPEFPPPARVPRGDSFRELAAMYPNIHPDDLRNFMPVVVDAAEAIATRRYRDLEKRMEGINRATERNNELMTLMQDPAFRDTRVQKEIHTILDSDPSIFARERAPMAKAYEMAMSNIARKLLQHGSTPEAPAPSNPPVTASGGNGSSFLTPKALTPREFDRLDIKDQERYLLSNGKVLPKK